MEVVLREATFADPSGGLADGSTDVAFVRPPLAPTDLWFEVLTEEPRVVALPAGHPLAGRESVAAQEILAEPVVGVPGDDEEWRRFWLLDDFRDGRPATVAATADTHEVELQIVASGQAVSVTCAASSRYYARPGVAFVPISDVPASQVAVAYPAGAAEPLVQNFVRLAAEVRDREG